MHPRESAALRHPMRASYVIAAVLYVLPLCSRLAGAQIPPPDSLRSLRMRPLVTVGSEIEDRQRLQQLLRPISADGFLLRSPSSTAANALKSAREPRFTFFSPALVSVSNSSLPASRNDGAMWAGRGQSVSLRTGFGMGWGALRVVLAPEIIHSANDDFVIIDPRFWTPPLDGQFSPYSSPWNVSPWLRTHYSIDLPLRFGPNARDRLDPGQSAAWIERGRFAVGFATENQWWGPGIENALILSNNAGGFPHLFARTTRPLSSRFGHFEARWLVGTLAESDFFDFNGDNQRRSITAAAVSWQPIWTPNITVGVARAVYGPLTGQGIQLRRPLQVFYSVGHPNATPRSDTTRASGDDQLLSVFGRWRFPADSFEVYAEVGRADLPVSFRDFLVEPTHSLGLTLGAQAARAIPRTRGLLRIRGETTYLENDASYTHRPAPSWYTSRVVRQGYTHRGQVLGASIGPGSSGQWLAVDAVWPAWRAGGYLRRVRWNNDAMNTLPFPIGTGYCESDVTVSPGVTGAATVRRLGTVVVDLAFSNRLNAFFENNSGCPHGGSVRDIRNRTLSISLSPWLR